MPEFMRAVDIKGGKGHADALFINGQTPKPTAGAGEAVVKIRAFGLNRMDLIQREGHYPLPPQAPSTLGVEFSGTIESLGPPRPGGESDAKGHGLALGDEVFGLAYGGAYAEYVAVSLRTLLHKPAHLSFEQAAAIPETWMTATQALHFVGGSLARGQSVLWHAGASGVSIAGIQLSRKAGAAEVYATAGSAAKCDFITGELGAEAALNYKTEDWSAAILERTGGRGVDVVIDFVGADYFQKNLNVAARDARIVFLGFMGGSQLPQGADLRPLLAKRLHLEGSSLRSRDEAYQGRLRDRLEEYLPLFDSGELKVYIDTVLPWQDIQKAHGLLEGNHTKGKIICTIA